VLELSADPEVQAGYTAWSQSRAQFLADLEVPESAAVKQKWEKHYFRGMAPDGSVAPAHQTKLELREAEDPDGWCPPVDRKIGT
jgi:anti-sigma factor RsiW